MKKSELGCDDNEWRREVTRSCCPAFLSAFAAFSFLFLSLALPVCRAQRAGDSRPAPLDPVRAEKEGRELAAELRAQKPDGNTTNTGTLRIRDRDGKERQVRIRFEVAITPTNWLSTYEALDTGGKGGSVKLIVFHTDGQPNRYELLEGASPAATNGAGNLTGRQTMVPFGGSDFWVADLGLEFLQWPTQRLVNKELRHSKSCNVLESIDPNPAPGGYARVVTWSTIDSPHGIVHADAYDAHDKLLKQFDPTQLANVRGERQLEEMEMRNRKTGSHSWIKFDLNSE
jgi:hypothetical protein